MTFQKRDDMPEATDLTADLKPDLTTRIGGVLLKNPVMTASGTFGYGREYSPFIDLNRLGAIVVKGLSLSPAKGNPPQRIAETPCGMLNAIGLENVGLDAFVEKKLPFLRSIATPTWINIYGKTVEEYAELARRIDDIEGIAGIELNISCPNVKTGGIAFGVDPQMANEVVEAVRKRTSRPLMVKLSPNVTDITQIARSAIDGGADALSLINTITGMAVDIHRRRSKIANITGGLSGPAIKPVALRMVWQVAQMSEVPVVGIGGIAKAEDALEFIIAGAAAVQIGTANFIDPTVSVQIVDGIERYMITHGISRLTELIGSLET
ncbi:dihydroorotate dehydrogenase [Desulfococcus multivorans]|jgi:dihydroorotate dehydrogenase (NAD+) catalytic subunit|uniref:Dihydroorotate dehydrogenase n=2 Tax=Desulfococcaceae TaxID=2931039 RepID=S7VJW4_DESML|nr:dihydroorotate dehydrogenase [Desulfococcus multivorans]EPR44843.1 Dihydroorotate dehydrogenase [Desulfococcus multivorans DSM 2059]SJZ52218.1 dihydroorotate oxidase B, catalytic subunit [Desulfococcus multivorans DSM 2059]